MTFNAESARALSDASNTAKAERRAAEEAEQVKAADVAMPGILEQIEKAASSGLRACSINDWGWSNGRHQVLARLRALGFTVDDGAFSLDPMRYYNVRW